MAQRRLDHVCAKRRAQSRVCLIINCIPVLHARASARQRVTQHNRPVRQHTRTHTRASRERKGCIFMTYDVAPSPFSSRACGRTLSRIVRYKGKVHYNCHANWYPRFRRGNNRDCGRRQFNRLIPHMFSGARIKARRAFISNDILDYVNCSYCVINGPASD